MSVRLRRPGVRVRGPGARHPSVRRSPWWRTRRRHRGGAVSPAPARLANTSVDVGTFLKNNHQVSWQAVASTHPVSAALHLGSPLGGMVLRTASVWHHAGDVSASLVETDPVVSAPHSVLDNPHVENTRAVGQPPGHYLALHVFVLVVSLNQSTVSRVILPSPFPSPLSLHQH